MFGFTLYSGGQIWWYTLEDPVSTGWTVLNICYTPFLTAHLHLWPFFQQALFCVLRLAGCWYSLLKLHFRPAPCAFPPGERPSTSYDMETAGTTLSVHTHKIQRWGKVNTLWSETRISARIKIGEVGCSLYAVTHRSIAHDSHSVGTGSWPLSNCFLCFVPRVQELLDFLPNYSIHRNHHPSFWVLRNIGPLKERGNCYCFGMMRLYQKSQRDKQEGW